MFEGLRIPDPSFLLDTKIQTLPGAINSGVQSAFAMRDLFRNDAIKRIELEALERERAFNTSLSELGKKIPQTTPQGRKQAAAELSKKGFGAQASKMQQEAEDWESRLMKTRREGKEYLNRRMAEGAAYVKTLPGHYQLRGWQNLLVELKEDGYDISDLPKTPVPQVLDQLEALGMTVKDRKNLGLDERQLEETIRHNKATEGIQKDKANSPGSPQTTTIKTDFGYEVVDRVAKTSEPVISKTTGEQAKLSPLTPTQVKTARAANKAKLQEIDRAIALVEKNKKAVGLLKGYAGAFEPTAAMLNKLDPAGIEARAAVMNIGSGTIHERSGAAVTIAEAPRLKPFIPTTYDDADPIIKKLKQLKKNIEEEDIALGEAFPGSVRDPHAPPEAVVDDEPAADDSSYDGINWDDPTATPGSTPPPPATPAAPAQPQRNWFFNDKPSPQSQDQAKPKKRNWSYGGN